MKRRYLFSLLCLVAVLMAQLFLPAWCRSERSLPKGFVNVQEIVPTIHLDIRYYGPHNFIGKRIDGYNAPKCILTKEAAAALARVQKELDPFSLSLKVYDCYRPQQAVDHFGRWAKDPRDTKMKQEFYPSFNKRDLFKDGYIAAKSGHSRGSTVDVTILILPATRQPSWRPGSRLESCTSPATIRFRDNGLDMGTGFDCFHELSQTINSKIGRQQRANRLLLKTVMEKNGFINYEQEWWHFTLKNEPFPKTYFDFSVE